MGIYYIKLWGLKTIHTMWGFVCGDREMEGRGRERERDGWVVFVEIKYESGHICIYRVRTFYGVSPILLSLLHLQLAKHLPILKGKIWSQKLLIFARVSVISINLD